MIISPPSPLYRCYSSDSDDSVVRRSGTRSSAAWIHPTSSVDMEDTLPGSNTFHASYKQRSTFEKLTRCNRTNRVRIIGGGSTRDVGGRCGWYSFDPTSTMIVQGNIKTGTTCCNYRAECWTCPPRSGKFFPVDRTLFSFRSHSLNHHRTPPCSLSSLCSSHVSRCFAVQFLPTSHRWAHVPLSSMMPPS